MANIDFFKSFFKFGLSQPTRYRVLVQPPGSVYAAEISIMCEETTLLGRGFNTAVRQQFGPEQKLPYQSVYTDQTLNFILSDDLMEKHVFDRWQKKTSDPKTNMMRYFDEYKSDVRIDKLDVQDWIVYTAIMVDAYPVLVGDISLGYAMTNSYTKLPVTFTFREWRLGEDRYAGGGRVGVTPVGGGGDTGPGLPEVPDDVEYPVAPPGGVSGGNN